MLKIIIFFLQWLCVTDSKLYYFSLTTGTDASHGADGDIYFRLKGSSGAWSVWFVNNIFLNSNTQYNWYQSLTNIGNPEAIIILSEQADKMGLKTITVESSYSYTVTAPVSGAEIEYDWDASGTGCSFVIVFFNGTSNYIDHTTTYAGISDTCPYDITAIPTSSPTDRPTVNPTNRPTHRPTNKPSDTPSNVPTNYPTNKPTNAPSSYPSTNPSNNPTNEPTNEPTRVPTNVPSLNPSIMPSSIPTITPSMMPSQIPSDGPSNLPSNRPSTVPSTMPSMKPSGFPSNVPSSQATDWPLATYPSSIDTVTTKWIYDTTSSTWTSQHDIDNKHITTQSTTSENVNASITELNNADLVGMVQFNIGVLAGILIFFIVIGAIIGSSIFCYQQVKEQYGQALSESENSHRRFSINFGSIKSDSPIIINDDQKENDELEISNNGIWNLYDSIHQNK